MTVKFIGLKEHVYNHIKTRLINNSIKPGERIWEERIAEDLEVSRTPVREAINRLVAEGFIENKPRKGAFAMTISNSDLEGMLQVRVALETIAVKQCCEKITESEMDELKKILNDYENMVRKQEYLYANQLDSKIHRFIAKTSGNKKLQAYINDLQDIFAYSRTFDLVWTEAQEERAIRDHRKIVEAICNRDGELAEKSLLSDLDAMKYLISVRSDENN